MKILGVSGSLSTHSANSALLHLVQQAALSAADIDLYDALDDVPNFSPDRDTPDAPPAVAALRAAVRDADVVLIATPEYAGGIPGVLKNALDWLVGSGELYEKRVIIVSAAPSVERGANARSSLEFTLRMQGARVCDSFTVAVASPRNDDALAASAADVLARVRRVATVGPCAAA